jgi:hypothetical protein
MVYPTLAFAAVVVLDVQLKNNALQLTCAHDVHASMSRLQSSFSQPAALASQWR